jgi:beta-mannosidase
LSEDSRAGAGRTRVESHERLPIAEGWQAASCPPDAHTDPAALAELTWIGARVPGTAAAALSAAGLWRPGEEHDFDTEDWWFRTRFSAHEAAAGEEVLLELDGIATVAEVYLNGSRLLVSDSMFAAHAIDVGAKLVGENELVIRCRALTPLLAGRRRPRARWRTRLADGNLRFFRTMLLGRAPGFAPEPAAVGPWREIRLVRRRTLAVEDLSLRPELLGRSSELGGRSGRLTAEVLLRCLDGASVEAVELELSGPSGPWRAQLAVGRDGAGTSAQGTLEVPDVASWWPHTHGEPALYDTLLRVRTSTGTVLIEAGRTGFRSLAPGEQEGHDILEEGLDLHINGVRTFARGAVWTSPDPIGLAPDSATLRAALERVRDGGMNMLRIPGTGAYESREFYDLCDELGLLVWQDFMFANFDYPIADSEFRALVEREAGALLEELAGRPGVAVLCGNSEVEQQVAMLGLDPLLGRGELFGELLPRLVSEGQLDAIYVPSAPCGNGLPFRSDRGLAHYFGVGGYLRPLEDARRAEVRFAAECLAFSNVPDEAGVEAMLPDAPGEVVVHHPRWKTGIPRDAGASWDFEDVRDHYLQLLFGVDPVELRRIEHERYLELSRAVTGEVMAEVFGEWRRETSPCGGALMLWLADILPGAGFGLIDHSGAPKPAFHHLRRALAPVAVWTSDEGLNGIRAYVANDRPTPLSARLRLALYREGEHRVAEAHEDLALPAHGACERDVEELLGHFTDAAWAYRFGPPGHDVVVASLEREEIDGPAPLSQAFRFPAGRPLDRQAAAELGLQASLQPSPEEGFALALQSRRLAYGVRIHTPGFSPSDDALTLEPGVRRVITLSPSDHVHDEEQTPAGWITALNMQGRVHVATE